MKKVHIYSSIYLFVVLLGFLLRFWHIDSIPNGLQQDELSIGYNAYSILKSGKDEYGISLPVHFIAFGEYKLPIPIYITVPSIALFGLNTFAVRLPFALLGSLTIPIFMQILGEIFSKHKKKTVIIGGLFLALNPWHIFFSRGAFEVTIALFFLSTSLYLYLYALRKKIFPLLFPSFYLLIGAFYSYNTMRITAVGLLTLYTAILFKDEFFGKSYKRIIFLVLTTIILLIPFASNFINAAGATSGTLLFSSAKIQAQLIETRSYMTQIPIVFQKLLFSIPLLSCITFIENIFKHIDANFFFVSGPTHGNHGIGTHGLFYLFQFPLLLIGILYSSKIQRGKIVLFTVAILTIATTALTRESPHGTRSFFLLLPILIFITHGTTILYQYCQKYKKQVKYFTFILFISILVLQSLNYIFLYTQKFPINYAKEWRSADSDLVAWIRERNSNYDQIIIDPNSHLLYISLLFYLPLEPQEYTSTVKREQADSEGFIKTISFTKYIYRPIQWENDYRQKKTLIITSASNKPERIPATKTFLYPKKPVVIADGQKILQFPVQDVAYVAVETQ